MGGVGSGGIKGGASEYSPLGEREREGGHGICGVGTTGTEVCSALLLAGAIARKGTPQDRRRPDLAGHHFLDRLASAAPGEKMLRVEPDSPGGKTRRK